jgi:TonB family protein
MKAECKMVTARAGLVRTFLASMMNRLFASVVLFLYAIRPALAAGDGDPALQQLLISASQRAQLAHDPSGPYELDVDFDAQELVPVHGHLTLRWEANDRWWRRIDLGDFHQIEVKSGEWHYTSRNSSFTPLRVTNLIVLLHFAYETGSLTAKKERHRTENGVQMNCIQADFKGPPGASREVCLDAASTEVLVDDWKISPDTQRREQFFDYFDFGTHRYPRKLELIQDSSKVIKAQVVTLASAPFDESLLTPPPGAIARRECAGMKPPTPLKPLNLQYPESARDNRVGGMTAVTLTVLTDGSVGDLQFEQSAGQVLDAATLKALRSAKFTPAMCGSEPVVADMTFEVNYIIR